MADTDETPNENGAEPDPIDTATPDEAVVEPDTPWIRGLWMLIIAIMIRLVGFALCLGALLQYGFYVFGKGPNKNIAELGEKLGDWLSAAARYQTGVTENRPWPWSEGEEEA